MTWVTWETGLAWGLGGALLLLAFVQATMLWRLARATSSSVRTEEKIGHFADALSLLTETTETGFRALAAEMERGVPARNAKGVKSASTRTSSARVSAAARKGRSIPEIAAAEQVSEGEVRLRLHLARQAARTRATARVARETKDDSLRA